MNPKKCEVYAMTILVFSDTHGYPGPMLEVAAKHPQASACFFLGDGCNDVDILEEKYPNLSIYRVRGNCDLASPYPLDGLVALEGILFYYSHGHELNVKSGIERLYERTLQTGADAVLYGHTHMAFNKQVDTIRFFNPGSICLPRAGAPTYGLITIDNRQAEYTVCHYEPSHQ